MTRHLMALALAAVVCGACSDGLSAPSQDNVVAGTAQPLQNLVTGVIANDRNDGTPDAYLLYPETMARNAVYITPNEPRFINELISVPIDPTDFIGTSGWTTGYATIRAVNQLLTNPSITSAAAGDKAATIGFIQTIKALQYIREVQLRDSLGAPIQGPNAAVVDPWRTKQAVLAYTSALLDSAYASLTATGVDATLPFTVPSGYKVNGDYSQSANWALLNRGLKGEVEVLRGQDHQNPCTTCYATAITALNLALGSLGASPTASQLEAGPYYQFNPAAPESFGNPLVDNHFFLTDNFVQGIEAGDARASKIEKAAVASANVNGLQLTYKDVFTDPTNLSNITRPLPIRRNAYFYLLRAQAEMATGNLAGATADVNAVHVGEGGLAPLGTFASAAQAQAAILYELRYSFILEGPYHLQALRAYGLITKAYVTQPGMPSVSTDPTHSTDPLQDAIPIPAGEVAARNGNVTPQP